MKIVDFFPLLTIENGEIVLGCICRQTCLTDVILKNVPAAFWALCI